MVDCSDCLFGEFSMIFDDVSSSNTFRRFSRRSSASFLLSSIFCFCASERLDDDDDDDAADGNFDGDEVEMDEDESESATLFLDGRTKVCSNSSTLG